MKARNVVLGLLLTSLVIAGTDSGAVLPVHPSGQTPPITSGTPVNPDHDCQLRLSDGTLTIEVPGSDNPHDFAPELRVFNAPRWMNTVTGDFKIQVKVEGEFSPGGDSSLPGRSGYMGAGIMMHAGTENCITLARATLQHQGRDPRGYINFEMRVNGDVVRIGQTSDRPVQGDTPIYLRLERRGNQVLGAVSEDGAQWEELPPKTLPDDWSSKVEAGLIAISTSKQPFTPKFSEFQQEPALGDRQTGASTPETTPQTHSPAAFSGAIKFHQKGGQLAYDLTVTDGVVTGIQHFGDRNKPYARVVGGWFDLDQGTLSLLIQGSDATDAKWRSQAQQFRVDVKSKQVSMEHALYGFGLTKENAPLYTDHTLDSLDRVEHLAGQE